MSDFGVGTKAGKQGDWIGQVAVTAVLAQAADVMLGNLLVAWTSWMLDDFPPTQGWVGTLSISEDAEISHSSCHGSHGAFHLSRRPSLSTSGEGGDGDGDHRAQ